MPRPAYSSPYVWWSWMRCKLTGQYDKVADEGSYDPLHQMDSARPSDATREARRANDGLGGTVGDEDFRAQIAAAKMMGILRAKEKCRVKLDKSLYGASIIMPQLARSAGWPKNLTVLAIRSYIFLLVNYAAQGCILYMIAKEENVWDVFAGQMYLCDFGRNAGACPGGTNCVGPGGTEFSPSRVYSWDLWTTRTFVRDSLKALFPDKAAEIGKFVDPGEYGVESYWCRLLCCTLFMVTVMSDLWGTINMVKVFIDVPNKAELWLDYELPSWADKEHAKAIKGWSEIDLVTLRIAGMPLYWKLLNVVVILLPKMLLWKITAEAGILFLMETSGIEDIVVNSVALAFILQIDELLCNELMSASTKAILEKVEDYDLEEYERENAVETMSDEELYAKNQDQIHAPWGLRELVDIFPIKLLVVFSLTAAFVWRYYNKHCVASEDGGMVSHPMRLPLGTDFSLLNAYIGAFFPIQTKENPFWTMPAGPLTESR